MGNLPNEQEHTAIIAGCQRGDRKAQEQLYKNYYRAMLTLCLRYTKNEEDAVEVLNNGFLKVFKGVQRYEPEQASLYTWIRTIVVRSCLDFVKAKSRLEPHRELTEAAEAHIPAEAVSRMKATELLQLVRQLPTAAQAVFNLYVIEGYSHREIATMLDIHEGTSKWHLNAARKALKRMIETQDIHE